jgi:hypothetical protein
MIISQSGQYTPLLSNRLIMQLPHPGIKPMRTSEPYNRVTQSPSVAERFTKRRRSHPAGAKDSLILIKSSIQLLHASILLLILPMTPPPPRTPVWTQAHSTRGTIPMPHPSYRVFLYRTYPVHQSTLHQTRALTPSLTLGCQACHDRPSLLWGCSKTLCVLLAFRRSEFLPGGSSAPHLHRLTFVRRWVYY